jgi:hypothetical protein
MEPPPPHTRATVLPTINPENPKGSFPERFSLNGKENKDLHLSHQSQGYIWQSWACCDEERKSASFFLLCRSVKLGFQKPNCALCALNFRRNF